MTSIREIASAVTQRNESAHQLTDVALMRAVSSQPDLNAFTTLDPERSLQTATEVDRAVATGAELPLAGVTIGIKDLIDHAGWPNTCGSSLPPSKPDATAPCVELLERAGAVVVGRTGLHEFAFGFSSENHWFGPVRNPWNTELSPGGSSGGSGAAVAAGIVPAALGTDTGGSVRVPAALCGIVGLKVTHGRGSLRGVFPLAPSIDTVGPLARTVGDVAEIYRVIAEHDPVDPWSAPMANDAPAMAAELGGLEIGLVKPWVDSPMTDDVRAGLAWACDRLEESGATLVEIDAPDLEVPGRLADAMGFEVAAVHRARFSADPEVFGPEVATRLAVAMETTGDEYLDGLRWRSQVRHAALRALTSCDVLLTPTVAALHKKIGVDDISIDGRHVHYRGPLSRFTAVVNHTGLPALALPLDTAGTPPPSIQLIGPAWSEARLLEIGLGVERAGIVRTQRPPGWVGDIAEGVGPGDAST